MLRGPEQPGRRARRWSPPGLVHVAGEVTTTAYVDIPRSCARRPRDRLRLVDARASTAQSCGVIVSIGEQSPDIAQGVDTAYEERTGGGDPLDKQGAGDQGLMFGYACDETPELMPLPIWLAHRLARAWPGPQGRRRSLPAPDGKTQVTIEYEDGKPVRLDTVVISTQHAGDIDLETLLKPDIEHVVRPSRRRSVIDTTTTRDAGQPDRPLRDRRPDGRRRADRPQDHRRHLRRHGPPRRRRVLRQGPVQGRPLGGVRDALGGQERRRRRARRPLRGPGRLRDRQGHPVGVRRDVRHRDRRPGKPATRSPGVRPAPGRDHPRPRPAAPDLPQTAAYGHFGRERPDFTWERTDPRLSAPPPASRPSTAATGASA
jgi:hypothetical protein